MQLAAPQTPKHRVLMSFTYRKGWHVCFFDSDRNRRQLPRLAFFNSDEAMVEFTRRASGPNTLEDRNIFDMMIRRSFGEIILELSDEQYAKLKQPAPASAIPSMAAPATNATRLNPMSDEYLSEDNEPFDAEVRTDEELVDYDLGREAGLAGEPNDDTRSAAWQRGWGTLRSSK
jgi:hypothetical protein